MSSSCLVIGCGYLGGRVADRWRDEGRQVFATTRGAAGAEEFRRRGLQPVVCDVLDPDTLRALPAADTVLYCVGYDRAAGPPMREVYVTGLGNVLARLPRPGRFLYVSSTGVYGQSAGEEVDETAPTEPPEESGQIALAAEALLRQCLPEAIILRFAGIYGPGRLLRRQAVEAGEPVVGNPDRWLNLIHVEDGVTAVLAAAAHGRSGETYNVCDGVPVRRGDFFRLLASLLGAPEPHFVLPAPGAAPPPHERTNRRIANSRMLAELGVRLNYPDYKVGLRAAVGAGRPA